MKTRIDMSKIIQNIKVNCISVDDNGKVNIDSQALNDVFEVYADQVINNSDLNSQLKEKEDVIAELHNEITGLKDNKDTGVNVLESDEYKELDLKFNLSQQGLLNATSLESLGLDADDIVLQYNTFIKKDGATPESVTEKLLKLYPTLSSSPSTEDDNGDTDPNKDDSEVEDESGSGEDDNLSPDLGGEPDNRDKMPVFETTEEALEWDLKHNL